MILLIDENNEKEPIVELQFNNIKDLEYFQDKLQELHIQMKG